MVDQETLTERWEEFCQRLERRWEQLSIEDLRAFRGDVDQLVGWLHHRTGERRQAVRQFLEELSDESGNLLDMLRERAQEAADELNERAREGYEAFQDGYSEAKGIVRKRPGQSLALAFGLGLVSGLGAVILLRHRSQQAHLDRSRSAAEQFGRQVLDTLANLVPESVKQHTRKP